MFFDIERDRLKEKLLYDIVIIGAGAAGIVCANRINKRNPSIKIAVIESGGLTKNDIIDNLDTNKSIGNKINFKNSIARYLGGKTNLWSGRIVDIDNHEFKKWPLSKEDIKKWKNLAMKFLTKNYSLKKLKQDSNSFIKNDVFNKIIGQNFNQSPSLFIKLKRFKLNYKKNQNLDLFINGTAVKLNHLNKKITNLEVISSISGKKFIFNSKYFVCCNGGLEVVKLLFHSGKDKKIGLANSSNKLGLNFSGHPRGVNGLIKLNKRINIDKHYFCSNKKINKNMKIEFGLELSDNKAQENNISKSRICFDPILKDLHSSFFYSLNKKSKNKRKLLNKLNFKERNYIIGLILFIRLKIKKLLRMPIYTKYFIVRNYCASSLNNKSKVFLSKDKDFHGFEKLKVDWKISYNDKRSLILTHKFLSDTLISEKLGILDSKITNYDWDIWNGSSHFMSTTIMSKSKKSGVVDTDCRTHDINNLYICGPSIFPTPTSSNPMLYIVMFSMRLSDHLVGLFKKK